MTTLITARGKYEVSKKATDILTTLFISQHESEPYHQHQKKSENCYGVVKCYTNTIMNLSGCPPSCWLLCMAYACHLLNVTASLTHGGIIPLQVLTGQIPEQIPDVSFLLHFAFWEPVYYKVDQSEPDSCFPSNSNEKLGHWVGFAEDKCDQFTWKILTDDTQKVLIWSSVCSAIHTSTNKRLAPSHGEGQKTNLTSDSFVYEATSSHEDSSLMPTINYDNLPGRTFLLPAQENGECKGACIVEHVNHHKDSQVAQEDQLCLCIKI